MLETQKLVSLDAYRNKLVFRGVKPDPKIKPDPLNTGKIDINNIDTVGWVFSGGGAKGVFEAGVACALAKAGLLPDVLVGTSVGALNAVAIADGDIDRVVDVWKGISKKQVYETRAGNIVLETLGEFFKWIKLKKNGGIKSLLDNTPLRKLLRSKLDYGKVIDSDVELMLGVTALKNGKEGVYATPKLFESLKETYEDTGIFKLFELNKENLEDAVIASSSIPVAFPVVGIDNELFVDGGTGNNTPAKNGIDALFAINKDLKEGLLFVVLLQPPENDGGKDLTEKNSSIAKVGLRTLDIMLDNSAKTDVKVTQKITEIIEKWEGTHTQAKDVIEQLGNTAAAIQAKATELLKLAKIIPDKTQAAKLKEMAEELKSLSADEVDNTDNLTGILEKYQPFSGKKKIKVVIIRPNQSFGVDTLGFDDAGKKSEEVIRFGYDSTLTALKQTNVISEEKYQQLMQENPYPVGNIFEKKNKKLSEVG